MKASTLRTASFIVLALSIAAPTYWARVQLGLLTQEPSGTRCGMPVLAIWCLALLAGAVLSLIAGGLNFASLRKLPRPRTKARVVEAIALDLPGVLVILGMLAALLG